MGCSRLSARTKFIVAILLLTVAGLIYGFVSSDDELDFAVKTKSTMVVAPIAVSSPSAAVKPMAKVVAAGPQEIDIYEDEQIKAQFMEVAQAYSETAKYPHFSQPITNPDQIAIPKPFEFTEVDTPFPVDSQEQPLRLSLATDKSQYFLGDVIVARLIVRNAPENSDIEVSGILASLSLGDTDIEIKFNLVEGSTNEYRANIDPSAAPADEISAELLLKVGVDINDEVLSTTIGIRYDSAAARLTNISYVRIQGEYLDIQLQYSVQVDGYFFTNAVLQDAVSGKPLLRLQAEGAMTESNSFMTMRAHIQALKAAGSEGPYLLTNIAGYRGAERGEDLDTPTSSAQQNYQIQGYRFDLYDDVEFEDDLAKERIDFLTKLGAVDSAEIN
jgi:hypothetical protein